MREGVNPEKFKGEKNRLKQHRVLVVFHIPNLQEDYYKESLKVLDSCLNSLVSTVNFETTNITLINNNSVEEVDTVVNKYLNKKQIDKYIQYSENRGKVYAVIDEVRGVFEKFVTITDCDVLFFSGWEQNVFDIFKNYPRAGVVSPLPSQYSSFNSNASVFCDHFIFGAIKYDKLVEDEDTDLYLRGVNNIALINKKGRFNWKEKQYYLNGKIKAVIGANHFVATYKSAVFKNESKFPEIKFENGYEKEFIDTLADKKGLYRLSTIKTYAYHIGNKIDEIAVNCRFNDNLLLDPFIFESIKTPTNNFIPYNFKKAMLKIIKKFNLI